MPKRKRKRVRYGGSIRTYFKGIKNKNSLENWLENEPKQLVKLAGNVGLNKVHIFYFDTT
jgi:hypothetical protein